MTITNTQVGVMSSRVGAQTLLRQTQRLLQAAAHSTGQGKVPDDGGGPVLKEVRAREFIP
eukprot:8293524-Pyramimonas_sp.AAC.1